MEVPGRHSIAMRLEDLHAPETKELIDLGQDTAETLANTLHREHVLRRSCGVLLGRNQVQIDKTSSRKSTDQSHQTFLLDLRDPPSWLSGTFAALPIEPTRENFVPVTLFQLTTDGPTSVPADGHLLATRTFLPFTVAEPS